MPTTNDPILENNPRMHDDACTFWKRQEFREDDDSIGDPKLTEEQELAREAEDEADPACRRCSICRELDFEDQAQRIPPTREAAIAALVEADVARWGEGEREAAQRMHAKRTYGLALNEPASRAELADRPDPELRAAANAALTPADRRWLKQGG